MRFVSQYPGFMPQIRPQRQRALGDGGVEVLTEGIYVTFLPVSRGGFLYENERRMALDHFNFHGNTQDHGEAVPTDPINRLSVLDTDASALENDWTLEQKQLIEARLLELSMMSPTECLLIQDTPIEKPFPNWDVDDRDPEALVIKLIEDGHDLDRVLYYEQTFGPKRALVIAKLEEAVAIRNEEVITA